MTPEKRKKMPDANTGRRVIGKVQMCIADRIKIAEPAP